MTIGLIGDSRGTGANVIHFRHSMWEFNWFNGTPGVSLQNLLGDTWESVNLASDKPLVSQALQMSHFEPDMVLIQYGQAQLCNGLDPTDEIELAVRILRDAKPWTIVVLLPAPRLEETRYVMRYSSFCAFRCPGARDDYSDFVNMALDEMADEERVLYLSELERRSILGFELTKYDCINPSVLGARSYARDVFDTLRQRIDRYAWQVK